MVYFYTFIHKNYGNGNQGIQEFSNSTILYNNSLGLCKPKFLDPATHPTWSQ